MPKPSWRACIVGSSDIIHASWMGVVFCDVAKRDVNSRTHTKSIEDEWIPMNGAEAIQCLDCAVALANWVLLRESS